MQKLGTSINLQKRSFPRRREDADDIRAQLDLTVQALDGIGGVELDAMFFRESHVGQHVGFGIVHQRGQLGEVGPHLISDGAPLLAGSLSGLLRPSTGWQASRSG